MAISHRYRCRRTSWHPGRFPHNVSKWPYWHTWGLHHTRHHTSALPSRVKTSSPAMLSSSAAEELLLFYLYDYKSFQDLLRHIASSLEIPDTGRGGTKDLT